jgi:hypothetical protein
MVIPFVLTTARFFLAMNMSQFGTFGFSPTVQSIQNWCSHRRACHDLRSGAIRRKRFMSVGWISYRFVSEQNLSGWRRAKGRI